MIYAHYVERTATTAVAIAAAITLSRQMRRPAGWPGRLVARIMNRTHRGVTAWGLSHLRLDDTRRILDVGCGGGRTIARLASLAPHAAVYGVDYASACVATANHTNAASIAEGRVHVMLGTVSALPFEPEFFDIVTAVETHYYWPDLLHDLREIRRVLKPGGTVAIVAETYRSRRMDWLYRPAMALLRATYLTPREHHDVLAAAGFVDVETFEAAAKGWICAVGRTPA